MSPTIQEQADQARAASTGRLPAEVVEAFARDRERMINRGTLSEAVAAGELLEDFILPDATGKDVSLSELVASGPAVLVFYRGGWCPYCNSRFMCTSRSWSFSSADTAPPWSRSARSSQTSR